MKTKKALAVLLAVVMLVMPLAVSSFAAGEIIASPVKTAYTDAEFFNPQGLEIFDGSNVIVYTPSDPNFRFDPALNEFLTVDTTAVDVYYDNELIASIPVTVEHVLGDLSIINHGHGNYCLGCGELHNFENHIVNEWIPNDDGGLFIAQTQTGYCTVCGAEVTESIPGTEKFYNTLIGASPEFTETEFMIFDYLNKILVSLIQMLTGIN